MSEGARGCATDGANPEAEATPNLLAQPVGTGGAAALLQVFKSYLEGRGAGLAHTPEFLNYYALPYVPQV